MIISHRFPLFFCCGTPHEGVEGNPLFIPMKRLFLFFNNRTASSSGFLYFTPQSHSGDFTLKPLVYNDILIFLRQQNSPALCKYIDEYFNDIITKKKPYPADLSVVAAFLTVLDGFITECSQRETLFPLLENAPEYLPELPECPAVKTTAPVYLQGSSGFSC